MQVIMTVGLPGSGKTTYAIQLVTDVSGWKRINKDDIRTMMDNGVYSKKNEKFVIQCEELLILEALSNGYNVILDNTHLCPKHKTRIAALIEGKAELIINDSFLTVPLSECIKRDLTRTNSVGEAVIRGMYDKYLYVDPPSAARIEGLPDCVIIDLDGTLSLLNGRNPYDASTCEDDLLNEPVYELYKSYYPSKKIVLVSGRKDTWKDQTISWLDKHNIRYDALYMRAELDQRKDSVVKQEIYEAYIKNVYNVHAVIDDRPQVLRMWRDNGLFTINVGHGVNF
jgi:predicted kinase